MTSSGLFHDYRLIEEGFAGTNGFRRGDVGLKGRLVVLLKEDRM